MNRLRIALAAILLVAAPVTFTGCQTQRTKEAVVWDTFHTTYNAAYSAYTGWLELVVTNKVSKADEARVDDAWNNFRDAFRVAFVAASQNWEAYTPGNVQKLSDQLIALIRSL